MNTFSFLAVSALAVTSAFAMAGRATEGEEADKAAIAEQKPYYPLSTCVISGEPLGADVKDIIHEGRLVRFCCGMCTKDFDSDPDAHIAEIEAAVIAAQGELYPLTECPISGKVLADQEKPAEIVYRTRLVRLCCPKCEGGFDKDPGATLAKIDRALIEQQKETYPLETCVISGEALGSMGEPHDLLYGMRLVRMCCGMCEKTFAKDPLKYLGEIDAAATAASKPAAPEKG